MHLIPTDYIDPNGKMTRSHQYSATQYVKGLNTVQRHPDLPAAGIHVKIDFTPFRVRWVQTYNTVVELAVTDSAQIVLVYFVLALRLISIRD